MSVDDPEPWLHAVGGLNRRAMGIQPTANETAMANLRLVLWKASGHPQKSDAFQEGVIGMLRAFEMFEPGKGTRFSTYAPYWIRQNILRMQDERFPFHVPEGVKQIVWGFRRKKNPTPWESPDAVLADQYDVAEDTIVRARALARHWFLPVHDLVAVDEGVPTDTTLTRDEWVERHDALTDDSATPEEAAAKADAADVIRRSLVILSRREREVIRWRFGFDGEELSLEDVGRRLDVTRERIRQIEIKAIRKLRQSHELRGDHCGTVGDPASWTHSQCECARLLHELLKRSFLGPKHVPNELVEAVAAYFFRVPARGVLGEMERAGILARSPSRDGWRPVHGIEELGLPSGTPARFAPPESAERLSAHWNEGVRAFDDRHFWLSPIDLAAEQTAEELEARIVAIARRERMIAVLLPRLRSDPLRDRRDALANEAKRLVVEREALSRALASHAA